MRYIGDMVRILLSLMLLNAAYDETGIATAICLFLIFSRIEIKDFNDGVTFVNRSRPTEGA